MGKILFVSSFYTGYGHRSISEALQEQIAILDPTVQVLEADGFQLGGPLTAAISRFYDRLVVYAPIIWKLYYRMGNYFPAIANYFTAKSMKKAFGRLITENSPDLIVALHPCFVSSVENLLEGMGRRIPVVSLIADLDNVSRLWADKRSAYTLCPTENARRTMLKYGIPEERIKVFGFPVRNRFNHVDLPQNAVTAHVNFLIMNGSQGLGRVTKMASVLLDNFDCNVVILAGNNPVLKESVENKLKRYGNRVTVCGFIKNVEQYMSASDILLLRASPNVMMEAVNMCKPFIVTGSLTGQEEKNPAFAEKNKLGIVCKRCSRLPESVRKLLADNGKEINQIAEHQREFRKPQAARHTAEFLLSLLKPDIGGNANETDKLDYTEKILE